MNDMSQVIVPKSDQINADDLIGGDMTITIRDVQIKGGQEQPVSIYFKGSDKAFRPCKSMSRVLVAAWGPDAKQYIGRSLQLYRDPTVKWGGLEVGGIRIRAMSHIDNPMTMALTATKGSRKPFTVRTLLAEVQTLATGLTLEDARQAIFDAGTLADLQTVWKSRAMAPFRERLQSELDARKAELSTPAAGDGSAEVPVNNAGEAAAPAEGWADEDRGEAFNTPDDDPRRILAGEIVTLLKTAPNAGRIAAILKEHGADIEALPDDVRSEVDEAERVARERVAA